MLIFLPIHKNNIILDLAGYILHWWVTAGEDKISHSHKLHCVLSRWASVMADRYIRCAWIVHRYSWPCGWYTCYGDYGSCNVLSCRVHMCNGVPYWKRTVTIINTTQNQLWRPLPNAHTDKNNHIPPLQYLPLPHLLSVADNHSLQLWWNPLVVAGIMYVHSCMQITFINQVHSISWTDSQLVCWLCSAQGSHHMQSSQLLL